MIFFSKVDKYGPVSIKIVLEEPIPIYLQFVKFWLTTDHSLRRFSFRIKKIYIYFRTCNDVAWIIRLTIWRSRWAGTRCFFRSFAVLLDLSRGFPQFRKTPEIKNKKIEVKVKKTKISWQFGIQTRSICLQYFVRIKKHLIFVLFEKYQVWIS